MKLTSDEILALQDAVGNASLALKYLHLRICGDVEETTITEIHDIGVNLTDISERILKSHKPLTFRRNYDTP